MVSTIALYLQCVPLYVSARSDIGVDEHCCTSLWEHRLGGGEGASRNIFMSVKVVLCITFADCVSRLFVSVCVRVDP